jgi:hypothetical protein
LIEDLVIIYFNARGEKGESHQYGISPIPNSCIGRKNAKADYVYHLYRCNHSRGLFGLYSGADVALVAFAVSVSAFLE